MPLFHKGHYAIIAGQFRRALKTQWSDPESERVASATIFGMIVSMGERLKLDNPDFDGRKWAQSCLPEKSYPFANTMRSLADVLYQSTVRGKASEADDAD